MPRQSKRNSSFPSPFFYAYMYSKAFMYKDFNALLILMSLCSRLLQPQQFQHSSFVFRYGVILKPLCSRYTSTARKYVPNDLFIPTQCSSLVRQRLPLLTNVLPLSFVVSAFPVRELLLCFYAKYPAQLILFWLQ